MNLGIEMEGRGMKERGKKEVRQGTQGWIVMWGVGRNESVGKARIDGTLWVQHLESEVAGAGNCSLRKE